MTIIEAIEVKYGISFTRDFFNETSGSAFSNLFLWLSRNKGPVGGDENQEETLSRICGPWGYSSGDLGFNISGDTWTVSTSGHTRRYDAQLTITTAGANQSIPYTVKAIDYVTGNTLAQLALGSGASRDFTVQLISTFDLVNYKIKWIVESNTSLSFTPSLNMTEYILDPATQIPTGTNTAVFNIGGTGASIATTGEIIITDNVPKIKTIDFLTGLFKMFNLTAYYIDDVADADFEKIYVDTLDNFYADAINNPSSGSYDISSMMNISNTNVDAPVSYTGIDFNYEEPSTLLAINHKEQFNDIFGDERTRISGIDEGEIYSVDTPFEHMKFERIIDANKTGTSPYTSTITDDYPAPYITDILWGYSADGDFESKTDVSPATGNYSPVLTKPLVFYAIQETGLGSGTGIKWISDGTPLDVTQYYRPSNTNEDEDASTAPAFTINFDNEIDEWNLTDYNVSTNSLFKKFYSNYVDSLFDSKKRMYKIKAYLSTEVFINMRLNDRLIINNRVFTINSIKTNLKTELSEIELLNVVDNELPS